ncbi:protein S100-A12-like [Zootoca vivipara]|uniref:protein S100-A12-like n=1 Tax=Zootoca vivipara TaxID=8524 RepID=UPI00293BD1CF|nr:protein S100-A12-like [Zootoca vivipara]
MTIQPLLRNLKGMRFYNFLRESIPLSNSPCCQKVIPDCQMSKPKTQLQYLADQYIELYLTYAGSSGTLDKQKFQKMMDEQFPDIAEKEQAKDKLFQELDANKDNQLSFDEVSRLIARYLNDTHEKFKHL